MWVRLPGARSARFFKELDRAGVCRGALPAAVETEVPPRRACRSRPSSIVPSAAPLAGRCAGSHPRRGGAQGALCRVLSAPLSARPARLPPDRTSNAPPLCRLSFSGGGESRAIWTYVFQCFPVRVVIYNTGSVPGRHRPTGGPRR